MSRSRAVVRAANNLMENEEFGRFLMNAEDFISRRDEEGSATTTISQTITTLGEAAQILNRSLAAEDDILEEDGTRTKRTVNVISPVVIAKNHRSWFWAVIAVGFLFLGTAGGALAGFAPGTSSVLFGWHFWLMWLAYIAFNLWRNSYVMIPDGCEALITRFGKVLKTVGAGRHYILHPWNRVGYIVNVTKEYPYNAPIREAPTQEQVNASVDLFLQFRINDPREFIFRLGGVNGFSEKLQNAISEQTRALIYSSRAEEIYDLIGESTQVLLASLNEQFMPAVEFVNANITHAEPSSQEYRMDLAAAEMVRVAKEAYNYQYELNLRKKRDEGDLDKELAGLRETLSGIQADVATYEARITTAEEKEINRANAYASQLMIEAEAEAKANVALFEAQALDIRALRSADYPEILEYRYKQETLERIAQTAHNMPQIVNMGDSEAIDYMAIAHQMLGVANKPLYSAEDIAQIRSRIDEISTRIHNRSELIKQNATLDIDSVKTRQPETSDPVQSKPVQEEENE
ncbi:MAG: SPFH domain-containing protein [Candidatus Promineifilaceae bacterium]